MKFQYKYQDLHKFNGEIWIDYMEVFAMGIYFRSKIKNISSSHIVSRFSIVPKDIVDRYLNMIEK